ncbi:hypothetical protein ACTOV4_00575 [Brucella sp. C7-11G]
MAVMFGWWIIPSLVSTACLLIVVFWGGFKTTQTDTVAQAATALINLLMIAVLVIISLIAWLVWAVLG